MFQERWLLQGIPPIFLGLSNVGLEKVTPSNALSAEGLRSVAPEDLEKLIRIFQRRERLRSFTEVTAVVDEENFQAWSFLQRGAKQGAAVCRIARFFSQESFSEFIGEIQAAIAFSDAAKNFNTIEKIKEIFLIPDSVVQEIFFPIGAAPDSRVHSSNPNDLLNLLRERVSDRHLAKINPIPIGTGFLVGGNHLLTNQHVLPSPELAGECVAQFNFEEGDEETLQNSIDYEFDPQAFFVSEPRLDYTLVQLKSGTFTRQAGYRMGWIQMIEDESAICPGLLYLTLKDRASQSSINVNLEAEPSPNSTATSSPAREVLRDLLQQEPEDWLIPFKDVRLVKDKIQCLGQSPSSEAVYFLDITTEEQRQAIEELGDLQGLIQRLPASCALKGLGSGDPVFIIQHPKGRRKQIVMDDNEVIAYGLLKDYLRYRADTDYGSSGSPVFNAQWQLVALHHAAVPKLTALLKPDPNDPEQNGIDTHQATLDHPPEYKNKNTGKIVAHQGIRICRIIEDLKRKSLNNAKLKSFIEDFVITAEQLNYPPLPVALELDGQQSYVNLNPAIAFASYVVESSINSTEVTHLLKFWSPEGLEVQSFDVGTPINGLYHHPQSQTIAISIENSIQIWRHDSSTFWKNSGIQIDISSALFVISPDGNLMAIMSGPSSIEIWKIEQRQKVGSLEGHHDQISGLCFSPDGQLLASIDFGAVAKLWRIADLTEVRSFGNRTSDAAIYLGNVCFSPDGRLIATGIEDGGVSLWDVATGEKQQAHQFSDFSLNTFRFSGDGKALGVAGYGRARVWQISEPIDTAVEIVNEVAMNTQLQLQPDGSLMAISLYGDRVQIWNTDGRLLRALKIPGDVFVLEQQPFHSSRDEALRNSNAFTIEAWVNPYLSDSYSSFVSKLSGNLSEAAGPFSLGFSHPLVPYFFAVSDASGHNRFYGKSSMIVGKFYHLSTVFDGKTIRFFINGELIPSESHPPENNWSQGAVFDLSTPFLLGAATTLFPGVELSELERFFAGAIAELRLWRTALTQEQLQENLYCRLSGDEEGLLGNWRLNEGESNLAYDVSPRSNSSGWIQKGRWLRATQTSTLPLPIGLQFSRGGDRLDCGNQSSWTVDHQITVEAWVKPPFGNCVIVSRRAENLGYSMMWRNHKLRVYVQTDTDSTLIETRYPAWRDRAWHHVAFTWDAQEVTLYVDGRQQEIVVLEGRCRAITSFQTQTIALLTGSLQSLTANLVMGDQETPTRDYELLLTEVRLWKVARPQGQIKANMVRRLSPQDPDWPDLIGYWQMNEGGKQNSQTSDRVSGKKTPIGQATWFPNPLLLPAASLILLSDNNDSP